MDNLDDMNNYTNYKPNEMILKIHKLYSVGMEKANELWRLWKYVTGPTDPTWGDYIRLDNQFKREPDVTLFLHLFSVHFTILFLKKTFEWDDIFLQLKILKNRTMPTNFIWPFSLRLLHHDFVNIKTDLFDITISLDDIWREMIKGSIWEKKSHIINPEITAKQYGEYCYLITHQRISGKIKNNNIRIFEMPY